LLSVLESLLSALGVQEHRLGGWRHDPLADRLLDVFQFPLNLAELLRAIIHAAGGPRLQLFLLCSGQQLVTDLGDESPRFSGV
jgi:hypothetical protein